MLLRGCSDRPRFHRDCNAAKRMQTAYLDRPGTFDSISWRPVAGRAAARLCLSSRSLACLEATPELGEPPGHRPWPLIETGTAPADGGAYPSSRRGRKVSLESNLPEWKDLIHASAIRLVVRLGCGPELLREIGEGRNHAGPVGDVLMPDGVLQNCFSRHRSTWQTRLGDVLRLAARRSRRT